MRQYANDLRGFTLMELLVVVGIVSLFLAILIPVVSKSRGEAEAASCLSNLRQLGSGFHMYAADHRGFLPDEAIESAWFALLSTYLPGEELYQCPSDADTAELGAGISFDWRDSLAVADPASSLAGRNIDVTRKTDLILVFDSIPGWHGRSDVQAATLDTSARRYAYTDFEADLARSIN